LQSMFNGSYVLPIIQQSIPIRQNCFFAHPENVVFRMLGDENKAIWAKAVN